MSKVALITGITGQDGAYLSKFLLEKGYKVFGGYRRTSTPNFWRIDELGIRDEINLLELDIQDTSNLLRIIHKTSPDEVYNLAAQSFVGVSFDQPIVTGEITGISVTKLLEAIREVNPKIKFYQASSSEMFGKVQEIPQKESTPFYPRSPYAVAKLYGHWISVNYREAHNMFTCSGILFNHESPLRGIEFITRKVTDAVARIHCGKQDFLELGNLDAKRDWGYAKEYVEGMWKMLQHNKADDYILATGQTHSIRELVELSFSKIGTEIVWENSGIEEMGKCKKSGKLKVKINPSFFRPAEVDLLIGDYSKAKNILNWEPATKFEGLVEIMVEHELRRHK
jgi:GDPmannose 4,6-dehydratase